MNKPSSLQTRAEAEPPSVFVGISTLRDRDTSAIARLACAHEALWATYDALERGPRLAVEDTCSDDDLLPEDLDEVF